MATEFDTDPANWIYMDLFPSQIAELPQFGAELRVITTDNAFYVFAEGGAGPVMHLKETLVSFEGTTMEGYTIVTSTGTYNVTKAPNCGCGSRLRSFHPFMGVPFAAQLKK